MKQQAGFTLPEILVSLVVSTALVLVLGNFMVDSLAKSAVSNKRALLLADSQQSLDTAANDIRQSANADQTNRYADLNGPSGNTYGWSSSSSVLVLAIAAQDSGGNILFLDLKNYIPQDNNLIYFVSSGTLYKRVLAAPVYGNTAKTTCPAASATVNCPADKPLLSNIKTFNVTYLDAQNNSVSPASANSIELHLVTSLPFHGQNISADYTTRMVFRN